MTELPFHNRSNWDRLLEWLYPCDEKLTDAEIKSELTQAGIDVRPAARRLHELIEQHKARDRLIRARASRKAILEKLRSVVGPKVVDLRKGIRDFIDRTFSGPEQVAHFHKLEKAATDEDLQSLMDDLSRLAELGKLRENDAPEAQ